MPLYFSPFPGRGRPPSSIIIWKQIIFVLFLSLIKVEGRWSEVRGHAPITSNFYDDLPYSGIDLKKSRPLASVLALMRAPLRWPWCGRPRTRSSPQWTGPPGRRPREHTDACPTLIQKITCALRVLIESWYEYLIGLQRKYEIIIWKINNIHIGLFHNQTVKKKI